MATSATTLEIRFSWLTKLVNMVARFILKSATRNDENYYLCWNRDSIWMCMYGNFFHYWTARWRQKDFTTFVSSFAGLFSNFTNETYAIESFYQEVECLELVTYLLFCFFFERRILEIDSKTRIIAEKRNFHSVFVIYLSWDRDWSSLAFEAFCCGKKDAMFIK